MEIISRSQVLLHRQYVLGLKVELVVWRISSSTRKPGFVVEWVIALDPVAYTACLQQSL